MAPTISLPIINSCSACGQQMYFCELLNDPNEEYTKAVFVCNNDRCGVHFVHFYLEKETANGAK